MTTKLHYVRKAVSVVAIFVFIVALKLDTAERTASAVIYLDKHVIREQ